MEQKIKIDEQSLRALTRAIADGFKNATALTGNARGYEISFDKIAANQYSFKDRATFPNGETAVGKGLESNINALIGAVSSQSSNINPAIASVMASARGAAAGSVLGGRTGAAAGSVIGGAVEKAFYGVPVVGGALGTAAGALAGAASGVLGGDALLEAGKNYINPAIIRGKSGNSSSIGLLMQGRYTFNIVVSAPSSSDVQALDNFFQWNGITVSEIAQPDIWAFGNLGFSICKTNGAVVQSTNALAANQMAKMLDAGIRFWDPNRI